MILAKERTGTQKSYNMKSRMNAEMGVPTT